MRVLPVRPSVCPSHTGSTQKLKGAENQNWCERSPGQKLPVCQFSVKKVRGALLVLSPYLMRGKLHEHRRRNNPLYEPMSAALKSRDSMTSSAGACCSSSCCLLILVIIALLVATAAAAVAITAIILTTGI